MYGTRSSTLPPSELKVGLAVRQIRATTAEEIAPGRRSRCAQGVAIRIGLRVRRTSGVRANCRWAAQRVRGTGDSRLVEWDRNDLMATERVHVSDVNC